MMGVPLRWATMQVNSGASEFDKLVHEVVRTVSGKCGSNKLTVYPRRFPQQLRRWASCRILGI